MFDDVILIGWALARQVFGRLAMPRAPLARPCSSMGTTMAPFEPGGLAPGVTSPLVSVCMLQALTGWARSSGEASTIPFLCRDGGHRLPYELGIPALAALVMQRTAALRMYGSAIGGEVLQCLVRRFIEPYPPPSPLDSWWFTAIFGVMYIPLAYAVGLAIRDPECMARASRIFLPLFAIFSY